jgi:alditol oxidase
LAKIANMNKREFLKRSGAILTSSMLSPLLTAEEQAERRKNWAGNYQFSTDRLHVPQSVEEIQQIVRRAGKFKVLGARHSFNDIADTTGDQISLKNFAQVELDTKAHTVTVGGGITYGHLAPYLDKHGYALQNLASLPHISVAGARSTATHGSGIKNGNLATPVSALELVTPGGKVTRISRTADGETFQGMVVDLGAFGVVTKVTLDLLPTFQMSQVVYENLPFSELEHNLDAIYSSGYSVSLFTDWQNHRATQVWIKSRLEPGSTQKPKPEFFGAKLATRKLHPLAGHSAENCTEQLGIPGPWYERMPHFRMNFTPSSGEELQSEYFVARERGYEAIRAVEKLRDHITPHLFITELRTIDADHLWISPCYQRPSLAIHFTWKPEWPAVKRVLPMIERQLAPFDARPHWAKLFTMEPDRLHQLYARLADYRKLVKQYDPDGKFRNRYLDRNIFV